MRKEKNLDCTYVSINLFIENKTVKKKDVLKDTICNCPFNLSKRRTFVSAVVLSILPPRNIFMKHYSIRKIICRICRRCDFVVNLLYNYRIIIAELSL